MPCSAATRASSAGSGSAARVGGGDRAHEGLEARGGRGHEPAAAAVAGADRVRHAARCEQALAGAQDVDGVAHPQGQLALEDVEALVVVVVDVQRRLVARRAGDLEQREGAAGLGAGDGDADAVVQEPEVGHVRGVLLGG